MKKDMKKPFFARLLETQEMEQVSGGRDVTNKYPSDSDEAVASVVQPPDRTTKYPSDSDELGEV